MEGVVEMAKASKSSGESDPVIIKKYANRRLYNTETSSYITLDLLSQMTREGREFVVVDAKTNEDITHNVLTQIIMEEEGRGKNMLPVNFLRQLRSEEHTSELQSLMRISYAVFCLKKKKQPTLATY